MRSDEDIRAAQERVAGVFRKRPEAARDRARAEARIGNGLACTVTENGHRFVADMPEPMGGEARGPTPGVLGRAAIASCIAIGIRMTAARTGVAVEGVEVALEMEWDNRGLFDADWAYPGPLASRVEIAVASAAPQAEVERMVGTALANDPWYLALTHAHDIAASVEVRQPATPIGD
jgi:uncharacterized OsmC-like protein